MSSSLRSVSIPLVAQEADIEIPLWKFGLSDHDSLRAEDLMRDREIVWSGKHQRIRLDPELPFAIWRIGLKGEAWREDQSRRSTRIRSGTRTRSSISCTSSRFSTPTTTASATSPVSTPSSTISRVSGSTRSGFSRSIRRRRKDDGYDIAGYYAVSPDYGTIAEFKDFVAAAHARGIRVIIELVINHTSDQHPWFQRARASRPDSAARNYYVWSDNDKKYADTRIIFVDTEKSNWTWDPVANAFFWHRFYSHQPDLNFDNPKVLKEVLAVMRFWLDMGVDGLRLDAIPYLIEREGTSSENLPETHQILKQIRAELDRQYEDKMLLAEANQWPEDVQLYFGDGDECHMAFHFPLMPRMYMAIAKEDRFPITDILRQTPDLPPSAQWAIFLRNHDELTLEMVTDAERDYLWDTYASDRRARLNLGIRRRLAPLLQHDRRRIELMNGLLLSMPGTPVIYYGDEIGMGDNVHLGDRDGVRTPMQWTEDRNGGFSRADPGSMVLPPIMGSVYGYAALNVEAQTRDQHSLLNWMRRMLTLRRNHKVFGRGAFQFLYPRNRRILAYTRESKAKRCCASPISRAPRRRSSWICRPMRGGFRSS